MNTRFSVSLLLLMSCNIGLPSVGFCGENVISTEELYPFEGKDGLWGFFNLEGQIVIPPQYSAASGFSEGLAAVAIVRERQLMWGYVDTVGNVVIPLRFTSATYFSEGLAAVRRSRHGCYGFIGKNGTFILQPYYDEVGAFSGEICQVVKDGNNCVIDRMGVILLKSSDSTSRYLRHHCGRMRFRMNDKWGYLDKKGRVAIEFQFTEAGDFSEQLAAVKNKDKWQFIDTNGEIVFDETNILKKNASVKEIYSLHAFSEGLARALTDNGWIYVDSDANSFFTGNTVVFADSFQNGMAIIIWDNNQPLLTNEANNWQDVDEMVKRKYSSAMPMWGIIDKSGSVLLRVNCNEIKRLSGPLFAIQVQEKWQIINCYGKRVINDYFTSVYPVGCLVFTKDEHNNKRWFDDSGRLIFSCGES